VTRRIGRENVRKRLAPLEGQPGRTIYRGGEMRVELAEETIVVRPAFGLGHEGEHDRVHLAPLFEELARDRIVAALLVRLGGYAVGVFDGERLVASKVGSRFVKNRHKKGGSSANRFRRRREEQERALLEEAAATATRVLAPWRDRVQFAALGGDRRTLAQLLAAHAELGWLEEIGLPRFFTVAEPRQRVLERLAYDLYAAELVAEPPRPDRAARIREPGTG
jgi:Actinobacteria/chloroflexi VLRF1 release factor